MRIYKTRYFSKWQRKQMLSDTALLDAIEELCSGLHNGNLSRYVYKKRIAQEGRGKRGSYRTIIAARLDEKAFFIYGYPKNEHDNISSDELQAYKDMSALLIEMEIVKIEQLLKEGQLIEVNDV
jgi:hypothetical protein